MAADKSINFFSHCVVLKTQNALLVVKFLHKDMLTTQCSNFPNLTYQVVKFVFTAAVFRAAPSLLQKNEEKKNRLTFYKKCETIEILH